MDIIQAAIASVENRSATAPAFAFAAGVVTSVGPCAVPRLLAVVGLAARPVSRARQTLSILALVCGLCTGYIALGFVSSALGALLRRSSELYVGCSVAFFLAGIGSLLQVRHHDNEAHDCSTPRSDAGRSLGGTFLLGSSFALVVSPCCTPIVVTIAGLGIAIGDWRFGAATLAAFAIGHAIPLVLLGSGIGRLRGALCTLEGPLATVAAGLLVALGCYYAVIA